MKAVLINNGLVENIIVWDDSCVAPDGVTFVVVDDSFPISIGWVHNGGNSFTDPNPQISSTAPTEPTLADLQAQLATLTAAIQSLAGQN
jgi:hypothetical protein